ncbi:unnamed protein product [Caenorhabditis sp. 36 PRJEB53466]|nr:unnamed protein product [Caenorhabditis sp. 36 PRJEB53466]
MRLTKCSYFVFKWFLVLMTVSFVLTCYFRSNSDVLPKSSRRLITRNITLFAATSFFSETLGASSLRMCSEEVKNSCTLTSDPKKLPEADAIVFHSSNVHHDTEGKYNALRKPGVPFVVMTMENPDFSELRNFYNWTMNCRMSSDVPMPYGAVEKLERRVEVDYEQIWNSKRKTAVWLVSNVHTTQNRRKDLTEKMVEKGMDIDLLGQAYKEPVECPKFGGDPKCLEKLFKPYKFAIAFENTNSEDYVTEKFWYRLKMLQVVPIVMTRVIYRNLGIPDSMYIAVDDFPTLKELVDHVKRVSADKNAYLEYHTWREEYRILDANEGNYGFCLLCRKLVNLSENPLKSYDTVNYKITTDYNEVANRYL